MHELQKKEFDRSLAYLNSIGCKYKVTDPDGNVFTNIVKDVEEVRKRKRSIYPFGQLTQHIRKHIEGIKIGEVRVIPAAPFDRDTVGASATSYMSSNYGNKSYTTHRIENGVEVLRIY